MQISGITALGWLGIAATLSTAATFWLTATGRTQFWTPGAALIAVLTILGAVLLLVSTDEWKDRCIATSAIGAGISLLAMEVTLYLHAIGGLR